jgi:hypothetical protein
MAVHDVVRAVLALETPEPIPLPEKIPMPVADEDPGVSFGDLRIVIARPLVVNQEVHRDLSPIDMAKKVDEPGFRAAAIHPPEHL